MEGMLARWQVLDIQLDLYTVRRFGEGGGANVLALGVLNIDGDWFGSRTSVCGSNAGRQEKKAHKIQDNFHRSSLFLPDHLSSVQPKLILLPVLATVRGCAFLRYSV